MFLDQKAFTEYTLQDQGRYVYHLTSFVLPLLHSTNNVVIQLNVDMPALDCTSTRLLLHLIMGNDQQAWSTYD
jgi:hypothetical protein